MRCGRQEVDRLGTLINRRKRGHKREGLIQALVKNYTGRRL